MTPATQARRGAERPGDADDAADVDADDAGERGVLADRAHGAADGGAGEEEVDEEDEDGGDGEGQELVGGGAEAARRGGWRSGARW